VIKSEAMMQGMRPIRFNGWEKVMRGITTIEEVLRVSMEDEFETPEERELIKKHLRDIAPATT
jgi:hypothetical protein